MDVDVEVEVEVEVETESIVTEQVPTMVDITEEITSTSLVTSTSTQNPN